MTWVHDATPEVDSQSQYPSIITINIFFTSISIVVVGLRFMLRYKVLALDEWITLATLVFDITYNVLCVIQTRYGLGLPLSKRPEATSLTFTKLSYIGKPFYQFGIAGFKLALCISYLRLTEGADKQRYRMVIWTVAIASTLLHFIFMLTVLLWCIPLGKNFDSSIAGHCLPFGPVNYTMASITVVCDLTIFFLPIPLFLSLSLNKRAKAALCFVFGLGIFTTLASIIRIAFLHEVVESGDNSTVIMLGTLEFNIGIIVSCIPFLRPLVRNMRKWRNRSPSYSSQARRDYRMNTIGKSGVSNNLAEFPDEFPDDMGDDKRRYSRSESEENILEPRRERRTSSVMMPGIVRTTRYEVTEELSQQRKQRGVAV